MLPKSSYGYFILNPGGEDELYHYWQDGPTFVATDDGEALEIAANSARELGTPIGTAYLMGGNDEIYGDAAVVFAGAGDDTFYNSGVRATNGDGYGISKGEAGDDVFFDFHGSTRYYGGRGNDYFLGGLYSSSYQDFPAEDWDHDVVTLNRGKDTVEWRFLSSSDGLNAIRAEIDGGKGVDVLVLIQYNGYPVWNGGDHVDFRDLDRGPMTFANATFSNFEQFELRFGDSTINRVDLGNHDDVLVWYDMPNEEGDPWGYHYDPELLPDGPLVLHGRDGDDIIIGSIYREEEFIYGGNGNDTITAGGRVGEAGHERLAGGPGDDVLYMKGPTAVHPGTITGMKGGPGADKFVVTQTSEGLARIHDFEPGEDEFVFDFTGGYSIYVAGIGSENLDWQNLNVLEDSPEMLQFEVTVMEEYSYEDYTITYIDGYVYIENSRDAGTGGYGNEVAFIKGRPDLGVEDFGFYDYSVF
ncbi:hypothetical protein [Roseovarius sp.]|uniref:hypothetical protein n=1 Tax=Roseovarius sp. TaxID=1486281 RepID=UPI00261BE16E|nr:hypothetical protein [Roseovarius sp.]MDM8166473.1 hypothetical protein [Roseovarius sp.]